MWKHVRFQLRFDDPRVLPENHVVIQGDRIQLEKLADAVGDYVQRFLHATPSRPVVVGGVDASAPGLLPDPVADESTPNAPDSEAADPASLDYLEQLHHIKSTSWADMARLALATSVVDPADLVVTDANHTAAHSHGQGEMDAIAPERQPFELSRQVPTPATNGAVAANSARDIGLEPKGLLHHRLRLGTLATAQTGEAMILNTTQLFDLATALDEYRTAGLAIPTLNQQRWVQRPASWGKIAAGALIALALTPAIANIWEGSTVVSNVPTNSENATSLDQQQAIARIDSNTITEGDAPIDPYALEALPPPPPAGSVQPNAPATLPRVPVTSNPRAVQRPVVPPPLPGTVAPPAPSTASAPSAASPSAPAGTVELEIAPQPTSPNNQVADSASSIASAEADSAGSAPATLSSEAARSEAAKTAFDTVPQVAQVRQYFQARWTPPDSLEDTLEYRLTLAPDGSLQEVTPLGQASEVYLDRTSIPLRGEAFISPSPDGDAARIRLVLSPDGTVQTFAE